MELVSENVTKGQKLAMEDQGQYLVWNDANSSDPTHSMLSKDHFRQAPVHVNLTIPVVI
jgi:Heterokaryon incompatibility protein Het-C